jgi:hypothetical protein
MTRLKQEIRSSSLKQEVRQIREFAQKTAASKKSARRFLISTGVYTAAGELKAAYR